MKMHLMGVGVRAGSRVIPERGDRTCRGSQEVGRMGKRVAARSERKALFQSSGFSRNDCS